MPSPTSAQFEAALKNAYLSNGFVKHIVDPISGKLVPSTPPELPDFKLKEVKAQAQALSTVWKIWQTTQLVTVPGITSGPSATTGTLP